MRLLEGARRRLLILFLPLLLQVAPARAEVPPHADDLIGEVTYHRTTADDTLIHLAREKGLGLLAISAANPGIDPWVPGAGRTVTLPTARLMPDAPREGLVINIAEMEAYFFAPDGELQTYAIGIGREGFDTPLGSTRIVRKQERPTWYPTESSLREKPWLGKVVPAGPENPLGDYAMYLGWPTYLLHSTNKPLGVGRRVSHGCIRFYPEGMARLFPQIKTGTKVTVVMQPIKLGWHEGELYLEAHPDLDQLDQLEATYTLLPKPNPDISGLLQLEAGADYTRIDWRVVEAELAARRGVPTRITLPRPGEPAPQLTPPPPAPQLLASADAVLAAEKTPVQPMAPAITAVALPAAPAATDWAAPPLAAPPLMGIEGPVRVPTALAEDDGEFAPERLPLSQRVRVRLSPAAGMPAPPAAAGIY